MNYWSQNEKNIYVAAHRGWCEKYPENTMIAFRKALELGVDQIEMDVHSTKDGEIIVMHDAMVDRTTDGTGAVKDMTLEQIKALDAGIKKGECFKGEKVPTFREFLELIKDHPTLTIDVELKVYPTQGQEQWAYSVCDKVLAMIDEYGYADRCVINSGHAGLNEYVFKKYAKKYRQHVYYPCSKHVGPISVDPYSYAYCVCMFGEKEYIASKEEFGDMLKKGVQPWAGAGVRDAQSVDRAIECGAYLITCNNPDVILELLRERGCHS
ncbi:MAG: hypothetical protein E7588_09280 [Ruminococcaceae bacterium]|nr:hypothetical protein [Oscillospiraceae bacterium]